MYKDVFEVLLFNDAATKHLDGIYVPCILENLFKIW